MRTGFATRTAFASVLALISVVALLGQSPRTTPADLVLKNGRVYTVDAKRSWAEAVAIKDGKIVYVGSNAGASAFQGGNGKTVDLGGRLMLPGFIDGHNHAYLRTEKLFWVTLTTPSLDAYKQAVQAYLAEHPAAKQVRGVGWDMRFVLKTAADTGRTPRQLLDDIVGRDLPAVFITNGHHEIWANSRAIQNAGVTKDTPQPPGASFDRDATTKEATGIFHEFGAQNLIIKALPEPDFTVDQFEQAILSFQQELAPQRGVTSVLVPVHYPSDNFLKAMQALDDAGKLTVRYDLALWANETRGTSQIPELLERRAKHRGKYFKIDTIKIFGTGGGSVFGSLVWDQTVLKDTIAALDKEHFRVFIHDIGPTSTYGLMLDAFEYARDKNGVRDSRHTITHVGDNASPLAARFKALDVRADGHPVPKAFFDAGVASTSSSDYPVRDFFPLTKVEAGVKNGVSLETMIASHTINGAQLIFAEHDTGSIEVGKAADLVVLDKNVFDLAPAEISSAKAVLTMFHGSEVYRDKSFMRQSNDTALARR